MSRSSHPNRPAESNLPHMRPMKERVENFVKSAIATTITLAQESLRLVIVLKEFGQQQISKNTYQMEEKRRQWRF